MLADLSVAGTLGDFIYLGACLWLMVTPAWGAPGNHGRPPHVCQPSLEGPSQEWPSQNRPQEPSGKAFVPTPTPIPGWTRPAHLHLPILHLCGAALHVAVVAAARAALHLHAGRPHQEVSIGAVYEAPRDLKHLRARLALRHHG